MSRTFPTLFLAALLVGPLGCDGEGASLVGTDDGPRTVTASSYALPDGNAQKAAILELTSAFHGALNASDEDAVRALFTDDATLQVGPNSATGIDEVTAFFVASPPFVNGWAALAPTYKTQIEIHGNRASFAFECVYVPDVGDLGGQSVVVHLNASGTMRRVGDEWRFDRFVGGAGPLS